MTAASYLRRSRVESRVETFMVEILMEEFSVTFEGRIIPYIIVQSRNDATLTLRLLMSYIYIYIYIYIYVEHPFLMFLDHTQRHTIVGRTPLDE